MDLRFITLIIIVIIALYFCFNELNTLNNTYGKYCMITETHIKDIKEVIKKETENYKIYTNDMLAQIRKMNNIEQQQVIMSDQFTENKGPNQHKQLAYLSDVNDNAICYMSTRSDKFIVKDDQIEHPENKIVENTQCIVKNNSDKESVEEEGSYISSATAVKSDQKDIIEKINEPSVIENKSLITNGSGKKLKNISSYTKQQLVELAEKSGVQDANKLTKVKLYEIIKKQ